MWRVLAERSTDTGSDSLAYRCYRGVLSATYQQHWRRQQEQRFYEQAFVGLPRDLAFDIGANIGDKTRMFRRYFHKVISVEPTPAALHVLTRRFLSDPCVIVVANGVGAVVGRGRFHVFGDGDYFNTLSTKAAQVQPGAAPAQVINIEITTLDHLIQEHGTPSYVKLDVEGQEWEALRGLTRPVPLASFECNLPEFLEETRACIGLLSSRLGVREFNYCTTEPPARYELAEWTSPTGIREIVDACDLRYIEIYCRTVAP